MSNETYNGWTNYETWNWKLWIDNDQGSYEYWNERAQDIRRNAVAEYDWRTDYDAAVDELANELEAECDSAMDETVGITGPFADLLGAAVGRIDWREIARSLLDDLE